ncbi:MAG: 3-oxoacyl-ACP reductase family protein [Thermodesulfobacteriota bacterium]
MGKLDKKVAIVTGGNTGIGRGISKAFHREGAIVVITYHSMARKNQADSLMEEFREYGRESMAARCDVSKEDQVKNLVSQTEKKYGKVDILVNNAGILKVCPFFELDKETWDDHLAVHLTAAFLCCKAVLPGMVQRKYGKIINTSSQLAIIGRHDFVHYTAAKAGLIGFTRALAREFGPFGINVNAMAVGLVDNNFDPMPESKKVAFAENLPARRLGRPEDIGETAVFLASDDSDWYMGQTLGPNGGEVML